MRTVSSLGLFRIARLFLFFLVHSSTLPLLFLPRRVGPAASHASIGPARRWERTDRIGARAQRHRARLGTPLATAGARATRVVPRAPSRPFLPMQYFQAQQRVARPRPAPEDAGPCRAPQASNASVRHAGTFVHAPRMRAVTSPRYATTGSARGRTVETFVVSYSPVPPSGHASTFVVALEAPTRSPARRSRASNYLRHSRAVAFIDGDCCPLAWPARIALRTPNHRATSTVEGEALPAHSRATRLAPTRCTVARRRRHGTDVFCLCGRKAAGEARSTGEPSPRAT